MNNDAGELPNIRSSLTLTHWGGYKVCTVDDELHAIEPFPEDMNTSPIGQSLLDTRGTPVRVDRPMVRESYLHARTRADPATRGCEPFVAVDWDTALDVVAHALATTKREYGNAAIFGGSYGWASAGRFHHAQSQIHRFLNTFGGYVASRNSYSMGAMEVILPRVLIDFEQLYARTPGWTEIARHSELVVCFGGIALKNAQVNVGGVARHTVKQGLEACAAAGVRFVSISPLAADGPDALDPEWIPARPNSDTAIMLALAYVLIKENLVDVDFVETCCVGYETLRGYVLGSSDGILKSPAWAEKLSGIPEETITALAREMAAKRTLVSLSWSVQRGDHGEQPVWMAVALAAMCGSMGHPGGGISIGLNAIHALGHSGTYVPAGALPQGQNPVPDFIPVARISDMLLNPGGTFHYDGRVHRYPDIRMIYWAGGNPFHHHQDIAKLIRAWRKPETIVVHEPFWTPAARFADVVLPCTTMLERSDIGVGMNDGVIVAMKQAVPPPAKARNDYDIFRDLAARLGIEDIFSEGRSEADWLRHIYEETRERCSNRGLKLPDFEEFWEKESITFPTDLPPEPVCAELRRSEEGYRLPTPSGKIELASSTIAAFGYDDCPGHPAWLPPAEWLGSLKAVKFPLHLISNQPANRLHSQLDFGRTSLSGKIRGREPCELHPDDARARNIAHGDLVRIHNDRGSCISVAVLSDRILPGVIRLSTGAWYDPLDPGDPTSPCLHGNPNVLTLDKGTSSLAQATTAHSCLVDVEKVDDVDVPACRAHEPPLVIAMQEGSVRSVQANRSYANGRRSSRA